MSNLSPFLLVAALTAAVGAATVSQAHPAPHASIAQLRAAAGRASAVEQGVLVLASR